MGKSGFKTDLKFAESRGLISARMRTADCIAQGPLSGANRKTFARIEFSQFDPRGTTTGFTQITGRRLRTPTSTVTVAVPGVG